MTKILQSKFVSEYGTLIVLLILFTYYTVATWGVVHPVSDGAARDVAEKIIKQKSGAQVVIVVDKGVESQAFAYLAIRSFLNLPISFPNTTGCKSPSEGGILVENF